MESIHTLPPTLRLRLSVMMFLQYFIWGAFFVPMGGYLAKIFANEDGLNTIIGGIYATSNWGALVAPLIVGLIADRFMNAERVNGILHLAGAAFLYHCSTVTEPGAMFYGMLGFFICYMPTLATANIIAFRQLSDTGAQFPGIRIWGTLGWIVSGLVVAESMFGIFPFPVLPGIENAGATNFPMKMAAVASVIYGIYSFSLPACPPEGKGRKAGIGQLLGFDALGMFKDRSFAVFAACSFLICIPLAFYYARTYGFASQMAFGDRTAGVMALGQVSEMGFLILIPFFLKRWGIKGTMLVGMAAWVLRYLLFGLMPSVPSMLVLGIVLHGICYDFFFVTGQLYTDKKAAPEIRASAQGLIGLLTYGAGMLVGNYVLGWWGDSIALDPSSREGWLEGATKFWLLPAGISVFVAILFAITFRAPKVDANRI